MQKRILTPQPIGGTSLTDPGTQLWTLGVPNAAVAEEACIPGTEGQLDDDSLRDAAQLHDTPIHFQCWQEYRVSVVGHRVEKT